jgi:hypothetical protein
MIADAFGQSVMRRSPQGQRKIFAQLPHAVRRKVLWMIQLRHI